MNEVRVAAAGSRVPSASRRPVSQVECCPSRTCSSKQQAGAASQPLAKCRNRNRLSIRAKRLKPFLDSGQSSSLDLATGPRCRSRAAAGGRNIGCSALPLEDCEVGFPRAAQREGKLVAHGKPMPDHATERDWCCALWQQPCHGKTKGEPQGPPGFDDRANGSPPWPSNMFR